MERCSSTRRASATQRIPMPSHGSFYCMPCYDSSTFQTLAACGGSAGVCLQDLNSTLSLLHPLSSLQLPWGVKHSWLRFSPCTPESHIFVTCRYSHELNISALKLELLCSDPQGLAEYWRENTATRLTPGKILYCSFY